ncbi:MAG: hypothetical protein KC983_01270 [Phycisphaerales bacterium]|nr:hypothetical protein [Phycisphaerales bacterium]
MLAGTDVGPFVHSWHNQTTLHPLVVVAVCLAGVVMLAVPRHFAIIPIILGACFIAPAQRIVVLTLDLDFIRILILFGWLRLCIRGELFAMRLNTLDLIVTAWCIVGSLIWMTRCASLSAAIYQFGQAFDVLAGYFLCRHLVRDWHDVVTIARAAAIISVPVAIAFLIENQTGRNVFHVFGGVPESTSIRAGRHRCQGAFAHPILAGCFWAILAPLIGSLWFQPGRFRYLAPIGVICAVAITLLTASSTPIGVLCVVTASWLLFPARSLTLLMRWGVVFAVILIQVMMMKPIWHLIARIGFVDGSTSWYRYKLIDEFIHRFDEWWLAGTDAYTTWWDWGLEDVTNQYVLEGLSGGLVTLLMFIIVLAVAFRLIGLVRRRTDEHRPRSIIAWSVGVMLLGHCCAFMGVSYFGQMGILLSLTLAMIGSLATPMMAPCNLRNRIVLLAEEPAFP